MKKRSTLVAALALALFGLTAPSAMAANWLAGQGTEKPGTESVNIFGFIQPTYYQNDADVDESASHQQDEFNLRRARLGVRGIAPKTDGKINYFLLSEWGRNGITQDPKGESGSIAALTDASVTLNHIEGARIRIGQFKTPTGIDALQGVAAHNYIEFADVTDQLMNERFGKDSSVAAFRDIGAQVFDWKRFGAAKEFEFSYALMYSNGNGINTQDNDDNKDITAKVTLAKIFDKSKGPRRQELSLGLWYQDGERTGFKVTKDADGVVVNGDLVEQDRTRYGVDFMFAKKVADVGAFRVCAESIWGEGWVFAPKSVTGTGKGFLGGAVTNQVDKAFTEDTSNDGHGLAHADLEAHGYYIDLGFRPAAFGGKVEFDLRYSAYDPDAGDDLDIDVAQDTTTIGVQYFFDNPKTKFTVNYEMKDSDWDEAVDDRLMAQVTLIFK